MERGILFILEGLKCGNSNIVAILAMERNEGARYDSWTKRKIV